MSRHIIRRVRGQKAQDGDGVKLTRIIGVPELDHHDPFLLLDEFGTDEPKDYIGGFPSHPHRGFETVTYLLDGRMRHKDNAGHEGVIEPGGVQWMSAARGIIHSEMPEQDHGLLRGFQLWINLPASDKMAPPSYQEFSAQDIPVETPRAGVNVKVITGTTDKGCSGPVKNIATDPYYFDISLVQAGVFSQHLPPEHAAMVMCIEGEVFIGGYTDDNLSNALEAGHLKAGQLALLSEGARIDIQASPKHNARVLFFAARALNEPMMRAGPFVMNTRAELLTAFEDYKAGRF